MYEIVNLQGAELELSFPFAVKGGQLNFRTLYCFETSETNIQGAEQEFSCPNEVKRGQLHFRTL